jgi:endoglucanase
MPYRGVNLAGAEFGPSAIPGKEGTNYVFPTKAEVDYFTKKGMNAFRIAFLWERIQSTAYGALDATYAGKLDAIVNYATSAGATVIIEPHNFARYYGNVVGTTAVPNGVFADLWKRLGARYAANTKVMFNLVNEPHDLPTEQWVSAANAAIAAIRGAGGANTVVVPGNAWTGAHSWTSNYYGTPNSVAMLNIVDPGDNVLFEAHQYLDVTSGGVSATCVSTTIGSERLVPFVKWLRDNGKKGFIGELGAAENATCDAAIDDMLSYMMKASDVLVGWTYWAAGPGWSADYMLSLEPINGQDRPRMTKLLPYLF